MHRDVATAADEQRLAAAGFRRIRTAHNGLYAFQQAGQRYCLKIYTQDARRLPEQEWHALRFLTEQRCDVAPQPVVFDPDPDLPALVMDYLDGIPLGKQPLTTPQLAAAADALQSLYRIPFHKAEHAQLPIRDTTSQTLSSVASFWEQLPTGSEDELVDDGIRRGRAWLHGPDPAIIAATASLAFTRGDPNLTNFLWDGRRVRMVDLEHAGWRPRVDELADLIELDCAWSIAAAYQRTSDEAWQSFVGVFDLSPPEQRRLVAVQRLMALYWLHYFWPPADGSADSSAHGKFAEQLKRIRMLCREDLYQ